MLIPLFLWTVACSNDEEQPPQSSTNPVSGNGTDLDAIDPRNPPVIGDIVVAEVTRAGVKIQWKTNIPTTGKVKYGETTNYGKKSKLHSRLVTEHEVLVENLKLCTDYHFRVLSAVAAGRQQPTHSQDGIFTSSPPTFSQDMLPMFKVGCMLGVRCHAEVVGLSELKLTTYDLMIKGGKNGNPIVLGNAEASLLVKRITGQKLPKMPLDNPVLQQSQIDLIKKWINSGAKNN